MFKTSEELKAFIIWAKSQGLKKAKVGDIEFELSELSYVNEMTDKKEELDSSKLLVDTENLDQKEQDELLFWSSR